jgi:hypothetical protein
MIETYSSGVHVHNRHRVTHCTHSRIDMSATPKLFSSSLLIQRLQQLLTSSQCSDSMQQLPMDVIHIIIRYAQHQRMIIFSKNASHVLSISALMPIASHLSSSDSSGITTHSHPHAMTMTLLPRGTDTTSHPVPSPLTPDDNTIHTKGVIGRIGDYIYHVTTQSYKGSDKRLIGHTMRYHIDNGTQQQMASMNRQLKGWYSGDLACVLHDRFYVGGTYTLPSLSHDRDKLGYV